MDMVHPTAVVPDDLSPTVTVGPYTVVDDGATLGADCRLESHVVIGSGVALGRGVRAFPGVILGLDPQVRPAPARFGRVEIGSETVLREHVTVNGAASADGVTRVGGGCLLMAGAHVGHDCNVGEGVVLVNGAALGGYVEIEPHATVSAMVPVHQYVRIGAYSYVGGGFRVVQDVPPYVLVAGEPLRVCGLNTVGLKRGGFEPERIGRLKKLYRLFYRSGLNTSQALARFDELEPSAERDRFAAFVTASARGVVR